MRKCDSAALAVSLLCPWQLLLLVGHTASARRLVLDGDAPWETAYSYAAEACPNINPRLQQRGDTPDAVPIAWYNPATNRSSLVAATCNGVHASVAAGMSLDGPLTHDCARLVFNSSFSDAPQSYANYQWLQSVRLLANGSAYGLVHNEFKAEFGGNRAQCSCQENATHRDPGNCSSWFGHRCELWSTGLAVSHDGGETFRLWGEAPPAHLVAAPPMVYAKDQGLQGYGAVSTLLRGSDGGYYGLLNLKNDSTDPAHPSSGATRCPVRTADLTDPGAFRARGASGAFDVRWRSPYLPTGPGGPPPPATENNLCATISSKNASLAPHTCIRRIVGGSRVGGGSGNRTYVSIVSGGLRAGNLTARYSFSSEPAFERAMFDFNEAGELVLDGFPGQHAGYTALLDHASPRLGRALGDAGSVEDGDNFALTDLGAGAPAGASELFVYVVAGHDILRRRVRFSEEKEEEEEEEEEEVEEEVEEEEEAEQEGTVEVVTQHEPPPPPPTTPTPTPAANASVTWMPYISFAPNTSWEVAFSYYEDACPNKRPRNGAPGDTPDSMPTAWYNRELNVTSLISATAQGTHASTSPGPTLATLSRDDCARVVLNSTFDTTPQSYANHQWLQTVRLFANGSAFGLVHNEFKSELQGAPEAKSEYCSANTSTNQGVCEYWSTGLAESHDGGQTFALSRLPPNHVVFNAVRPYVKDQANAGYGALGTLLPGSDGYYYGMANCVGRDAEISGAVAGNCPIRSNDLSEPKSYRGWDGTGYTVTWSSPYAGDAGLEGKTGNGQCATLRSNESTPFDSHVCVRRFVDGGGGNAGKGFIAVGMWKSSATGVSGVRYSVCEQEGAEAFEQCAGNYSRWTSRRVLNMSSADRWMGARKSAAYPVVLDHASPRMGEEKDSGGAAATMWKEDGDNYALTSLASDSLYVYFVTSNSNIIRRKIVFSSASAPPPPSPPTPIQPPLPPNCTAFDLSGAGLAATNGRYTKQPQLRLTAARPGSTGKGKEGSDHHPLFVSLDRRYSIHAQGASSRWYLTEDGDEAYLYVNENAEAISAAGRDAPPSWGWSIGLKQNGTRGYREIVPAPAALRVVQ